MSRSPSLWSRIRKGRLVQVLVVYIGASWLLVQVTETLMTALSLPDWVGPVVVILLMVGLLVVLATAWVQSHPVVAERSEVREVPGRWAVDVRDLGRSVRRGRMPHLTWGRTVIAGVVAFSLLVGLAGAWVLLTGRSSGPTPLAASTSAAPGVAVLPFEARGLDEELWSIGIVDLLATNLDGVSGLRSIDGRTVLARWRESRGDAAGDLRAILRVAASTGARWAVVGSAVGTGGNARISARLYDVESGAERGSAQVEGDPAGILSLVDELSIDLVRDLIREGGLPEVPSRNLAGITTSSVPALRAYLRGEAANRRGDFRAAIQGYEEALAADSTFALAAHRLSIAYGWIENRGSERTERYRALAAAMSDRLPERDAALLRASNQALLKGDPAGLEALERLARTYPDDAEVWTMLGEARFHLGPMALVPASTSRLAFETAVALDSAFAPAYIHPIELSIASGREPEVAARLLAAYERYGSLDVERVVGLRIAYHLMYGSAGPPPTGDTLNPSILGHVAGALIRGGTTSAAAFPALYGIARQTPGAPLPLVEVRGAVSAAELGRTSQAIERWPRVPPGPRALIAYTYIHDYDSAFPPELLEEVLNAGATSDPFSLFAAGVIATRREDEALRVRAIRELTRFAEESPDSVGWAGKAAEALEALELWRRGRRDDAFVELERIRVQTARFGDGWEDLNETLRTWLGRLEAERGRHDSALRYLESVPYSLAACLYRAESLEALGRTDEATRAYGDLARLWAEADPDFEPAERVRQALMRLSAES
jgi:tetratricopeptide (TPR) repeat protein